MDTYIHIYIYIYICNDITNDISKYNTIISLISLSLYIYIYIYIILRIIIIVTVMVVVMIISNNDRSTTVFGESLRETRSRPVCKHPVSLSLAVSVKKTRLPRGNLPWEDKLPECQLGCRKAVSSAGLQGRSHPYWFTEFCNSQCLSHFAAPFTVVRAETSVAESCKTARMKGAPLLTDSGILGGPKEGGLSIGQHEGLNK